MIANWCQLGQSRWQVIKENDWPAQTLENPEFHVGHGWFTTLWIL